MLDLFHTSVLEGSSQKMFGNGIRGNWTNPLSVLFKADQSDFCTASGASARVPIGAMVETRCASPPRKLSIYLLSQWDPLWTFTHLETPFIAPEVEPGSTWSPRSTSRHSIQSRVSVIWHQCNTVNYTTCRLTAVPFPTILPAFVTTSDSVWTQPTSRP